MAKNKLAKFADMATYNNVFQYDFETLSKNKFPLQGIWNSYFGNNNPIVIELGCGKGEYTIELAKKFPEKNFIGIDIKGARMWKGATQAIEENVTNTAFVRTRVELINHFFSENEVSEIWITFPDPQMKKINKRLTSTRFMEKYSHILGDERIIHLKTDSNFLYQYTKAVIKDNEIKIQFDTNDLYSSNIRDYSLNIRTFYEQQWLDRGLTIKYIRFICPNKSSWIEPDVIIEPDKYRSFGRNSRMHIHNTNK